MGRRISRFLLVLAGSLVVVAVTGVLSANATSKGSETFYLTQQDDFTPLTWTADGVFADAGVWTRGNVTFSGGKSPVFAGMIQTFETNTAGTGSFRMNFQGLGYNPGLPFSGTWSISQGTGIYAGLHGTGTWYEVDIPDPNRPGHTLFTFPCTGEVHFD